MGLKFARMEGSRFFFIRSGLTTACLKAAGTHPEVREVFKSNKILAPTESKTSLRRREGMLSEVQFVGRRCLTTSEREERDTGSKWSRTAGHRKGAGSGVALVWASLRADTFSIKNVRNLSQRVVDGTIEETSQGLMIELRTLKRT